MVRRVLILFILMTFGSIPAYGQDIYGAIESGVQDLVERHLTENPELLNAQNEDGMTPLLVAISSEHPGIASWLLERGADATIANNIGITTLHYSALRGYPDLIERLVALGLDVNVQTRAQSTPLLHASGNSEFETTRRLLELGANTELPNDYGRTPLLNVARESGDLEMARLLIEYGANADALDTFDDSPIVLAAWRGFSSFVNLLLDNGADVPITGERGYQLVKYSAERGLDRLMGELVERGADLSIDNGQGGSLVHAAALGGSVEIVRLLLEQGLTADTRDVFGWTPLHYAAGKGRTRVVELLVEQGADIDALSLSGHSPYSLASEEDRTDVVDLLVSAGAEQLPRQFPELTGPYLGQASPTTEAELFAPDIVAINWGGHSNVTFSPDGAEAFWTPYTMPSDSGYGHSGLVGSRIVDGHWTVPEVPAFGGTGGHDGDVPIFSHDGNRLYFLSTRPLAPGGQRSGENIWIVDKTAEGWGEPYPAPGEVNSWPKHWQFTLTDSGTIYFAGSGPDAIGRGDVYRSTLVNGAYTTPENLGDVINTTSGEDSPYIAPDESYLLFTSSGHEGAGDGLGIYISWNDGDGGWTEPVYTGIIGLCPLISHDGRFLFYRGRGDLGGVRWRSAAFLHGLRPLDPFMGQEPPGSIPAQFAPEIFGNEFHANLVFSPDGSSVYWSEMEGSQIQFMERGADGWTSPQTVPFALPAGTAEPMLAPDGETLFFVSSEPIEGDEGENIWRVIRTAGGWSEPEPVGSGVNSHSLHWTPSVSRDGTLYFSAGDIYRSRLNAGVYEEAESVGSGVNTDTYETTPFVAPDGSYLLFSRTGQSGMADLYVSFPGPDGSWLEAVSLGDRVNTVPNHELGPVVSPDGEFLFFLRNVDGDLKPHWVRAAVFLALST